MMHPRKMSPSLLAKFIPLEESQLHSSCKQNLHFILDAQFNMQFNLFRLYSAVSSCQIVFSFTQHFSHEFACHPLS